MVLCSWFIPPLLVSVHFILCYFSTVNKRATNIIVHLFYMEVLLFLWYKFQCESHLRNILLSLNIPFNVCWCGTIIIWSPFHCQKYPCLDNNCVHTLMKGYVYFNIFNIIGHFLCAIHCFKHFTCISFSFYRYTIIIFILQIRKLKHREIK